MAFVNLQTGEEILWNERMQFHAASTMKTPVMIEVFKQVAMGNMALQDSVLIKNEFKSIYRDVTELKKMFVEILQNQELVDKMAFNGRKLVEERFETSKVCGQFDSVVRQLF